MPTYRKIRLINDIDLYSEVREKRNKDKILQFEAKQFTVNEDVEVDTVEHVWSRGDRLYKLSHKYYESTEYWWVIAFFNQKPTEAHFKYGDVVYVPVDISEALHALGED